MSSMDPKALVKLAEACRKAGIKHFKNAEMEFTLTDDAPVSNYKKKKIEQSYPQSTSGEEYKIDSDIPSQEALLFWSSIEVPTASPAEGN